MSQHEPEATPAQQEAVRRLLAEARHPEPLPDDVVTRLDGVLAQLAAEGPRAVDPPEPEDAATVVDLAARRRRRVTSLLGAAAAVVVLGVGVGQLVDHGSSDDSAGESSSAARATSDDAAEGAAEGGSVAGADGYASTEESGPAAAPQDSDAVPAQPAQPDRPSEVRRIGSGQFQETVLRLRGSTALSAYDDQLAYSANDLSTDPMYVCAPTELGRGDLVPVFYVGSPAVLAYRPPTGSTQVVELLQCGTGEVLRSVVVPAP